MVMNKACAHPRVVHGVGEIRHKCLLFKTVSEEWGKKAGGSLGKLHRGHRFFS